MLYYLVKRPLSRQIDRKEKYGLHQSAGSIVITKSVKVEKASQAAWTLTLVLNIVTLSTGFLNSYQFKRTSKLKQIVPKHTSLF